MANGDPSMTCSLCGAFYYIATGHICGNRTYQYRDSMTAAVCPGCGFSGHSGHYCPGPRREPQIYTSNNTYTAHIVPSPGWECPRCKQVWAYWVPKCDCKPEPEKCALCGRPEGGSTGTEHVSLEYLIGWPSHTLDGERVCNICITTLVDAEYERRNPKS